MSTIFLNQFLREVLKNLAKEDYDTIAKELLPIVQPHCKVISDVDQNQLKKLCDEKLVDPWNSIVFFNIQSRTALSKNSFIEAFDIQEHAVMNIIRNMSALTRKHIPLLLTLIVDLKFLAILADKQLSLSGNKKVYLEKSTLTITRAFSACLNDRLAPEDSFKWGVYGIINILFGVYLKLNSFNLYKSILRSIEAAGLPPLQEYPITERITYGYYLGRYALFNEDYRKAREHLNSSFKMVPVEFTEQRRQILTYLIPVMLYQGSLPRANLLDQFPDLSAIYSPVLEAIRAGNLLALKKAIELNERYFLDKGVYLILEKAKNLTSRKLVRNIYILSNCDSRLSMDRIHTAFKTSLAEPNLPYDEVECLTAVLAFNGYITGYISHERKYLVLSKVDPFPSLLKANPN